MGTITDGSRYGTPSDAGTWVPTNDAMPQSPNTNNIQVAQAKPAVAQGIGSPLSVKLVITDRLDTTLTQTDQIYLWENTPNRYFNGVQFQVDSGVTVKMSMSETTLVQQDQAVLAAGGTPVPLAHWTTVTLDANGYAEIFGQVTGIWFTGKGKRVTVVSQ